MQYHYILFIFLLIFIIYGQCIQSCQKFPNHYIVNAIGSNQPKESLQRCFMIEQCYMLINTTEQYHIITLQTNQLLYLSITKVSINYYPKNSSIIFKAILNNQVINQTEILLNAICSNNNNNKIFKRYTKDEQYRFNSKSSLVITFNSSSFIDYHYKEFLDYPLRLSLRFRTIGRISNGVLLSLTHRKSSSLIIPFIIIEHSNGKIEITILQLDERKILSTVTTIQCGKNINNDNWHWLQFEIDQNGIFTLVVDDDSRTSQIPSYVVTNWNINALLVGDTRRLSSDIFQPFIGYMNDLVFNDEYLFHNLIKPKQTIFEYEKKDIIIGYRIAFFNLVTIDTPKSYIAFSERESQNKNHGRLDIYFLFRSYVPDGIILYRYAQGLNEYFAIGLRAGILALFIDFGFGKRQIVSDESTKLSDGKWHEVRVTRMGTDKIELIVDNRVNRSTLSTNGIRNAVSLQPVLYIGGIPNSNNINLTGSGLNPHGFQGCLASFIVDGRLLDYQRALVLNGQVKMNACSDLNKLCYDFTCIHSGVCSTNDQDGAKCDCIETGYIGERCDKLPKGYYFGKHHTIGLIEYVLLQARQTEYDTISFGLQTLSMSAQIFRLESDSNLYSLEYEIVRGRSYIKLNLGEKQPDIYSGVAHVTDGMYHAIKVIRKLSKVELYVDGIEVKLEGGNKNSRQSEQRAFLAQRRLRIGSFKNNSQWNGVLAGLTFNRQSLFDSLSDRLILSGDVEEVYSDKHTGIFNLVDSYHIATAIISSTTTVSTKTKTTIITILPITNRTFETSTLNLTDSTTTIEDIPVVDNLYHPEYVTEINLIEKLSHQTPFEWFYKQITHFGIRGLIIGSVISICLLLFLLLLIVHLHCKSRNSKKKISYKYNQTNGNKKIYSQMKSSNKHLPKFLRYLNKNQSKPSTFRLKSNGSITRLNSSDSYHLISSIQENHKDKKILSSSSPSNDQTIQSSPTIYHQVNRFLKTDNESPPLPLANLSHCHLNSGSTTLRSIKKDIDNSSAQTYSAVYSCELAANLDIDQEYLLQQKSSIKRRSILKMNQMNLKQNQILFLYMKNLVDCYAMQMNNNQTNLLATADENRIQLFHIRSGNFHSQLPVSSVGACHNILFSSNGSYLIGLFYEVTSNVNPYAVKIWSTDDYSIRCNLHPIKCTIAQTSQHSSILYMAGKQKYGRGISFGLLDIDSCSLARELKSDPDTSIGDEIRRIILTKNECYALVACTEYTSTYTCFVVFKLETPPTSSFPLSSNVDDNDNQLISGSMNNCTMILTKFNCDPNFTYSIIDTNNNGDQYMLTILRTNEIIIWQLTDGEILFSYDFNYLFIDKTNNNQLLDCKMNENRLFVLTEQGSIYIWDIIIPLGQFLLISNISDPLIHSVCWLNYQHILSLDHDGQRIRLWNIDRKEVVNEYISLQSTIQSLNVHSIINKLNNQKEYFLVGLSMNERCLVMFEYTQINDDQSNLTNNIVAC